MNDSSGFLKILIAVALVAVVGIFGGLRCSSGCSGQDQAAAEAEARKFCQTLGLKVVGVSCARLDSDGDGYVSCTVSVDDGKGGNRIEPIECARSFGWNEGCRVQKMTLQNRK